MGKKFFLVCITMTLAIWVVLEHAPVVIGDPSGSPSGLLAQEIKPGTPEASFESQNAVKQHLKTALRFYYDEDYEKALPLFEEVLKLAPSVDVLYWIGHCEAKTGKYDLAVKKFKQMLSANPKLYRVQLELADTLVLAGRREEANSELLKIKAASPPAIILAEVDQRLEPVDRKTRNMQWNLIFSQGYQYDDNISSGPDRGEVQTIDGLLGLSKTQKKLGSHNWLTDLWCHGQYDIGKPGGWVWDGQVDLFYSQSGENEIFNYLTVGVTTGPGWVGAHDVVKFPVGYRDTSYGEEQLFRAFHVDPEIEHFFNRSFSVRGIYTFAVENYTDRQYDDFDNALHRGAIGPNVYLDLNGWHHVLSGLLSLENRDTDVASTSYNAGSVILSYYVKLPMGTEFVLNYRFQKRDYDGPSDGFQNDREDTRNTVAAEIGQRFFDRFFASFEYAHTDNDSNTALFSYKKNTYTVKAGIFF